MGCCGKIKTGLGKAKNIAHGLGSYVIEKTTNRKIAKYEFTDDRIRTCQQCDFRKWIGRTLWCSICDCFVPGKARVESEKCPKNKW